MGEEGPIGSIWEAIGEDSGERQKEKNKLEHGTTRRNMANIFWFRENITFFEKGELPKKREQAHFFLTRVVLNSCNKFYN